MSDIQTITIGETTYTLRTWPALTGFKYSRVILRAIADAHAGINFELSDIKNALSNACSDSFRVDPNMIDKVLSDSNMDHCFGMIAHGLVFDDGKGGQDIRTARMTIDKWGFPDMIAALIAVGKFNLVFLMGHVSALFQTPKSNVITTQPEVALQGSADAPSTKS